MVSRILTRVVLCLASLVCIHGLALPLEFSVDGGNKYHKAGTLSIDKTAQGLEAAFDSDSLSKHQLASSFIRIRIPSSEASNSPYVYTAIPVHCLTNTAETKFVINLASASMTSAKSVASLSLDSRCSGSSSSSDKPASFTFPRISAIRVKVPTVAPDPSNLLAVMHAQQQAGMDALPQQKQQGKESEKPKDDRTWLQKNWMFLLVAMFMMFNRMANIEEPPAGPGGGPPGASGPVGPPRR